MTHKTYSAESPADLRILWREHGEGAVLADLGPGERRSSASRWSLEHLIAYRLLAQPEKYFLETFDLDHRLACPICRPGETSAQNIRQDTIRDLLEHGGPTDLLATERELLESRPGGFFWVSLAQACHPDAIEQSRTYPGRVRQPPMRSDYVDSSAAIQGSSSPTHPSSSEYDDQASQDIDDDENEERRRIPEDIAVRLATDFIRYVV